MHIEQTYLHALSYKLKKLYEKIFGITKYCLNLEIEILDIYPLIALVEAL